MSMARNPVPFNRAKSRFKPQPTVLVICEDRKSGKQYLEDASRHLRADVYVDINHCGNTDPRGIVAEAISRQGKFDRVFCAIDRDNHNNFDEAVALAKTSSKIDLIVSYPCFEFWLLLHYGYTRKPYTAIGRDSAADLLIRDLRNCPDMPEYDKGDKRSIFNMLLGDKFDFARKTAPQILEEAINDSEMNPSTRLHELLNYFESLSKPQLL